MMHVRRDVLLMALTIIIGSFAAVVLIIANKSEWSIGAIVWNAILLLLLLSIMWCILKVLQIMYEKEAEQRKTENKQLVDDTVKETLKELGMNK